MTDTSATGGFLLPDGALPPDDDIELDKFFQRIVVGITGIDPTLIRPRWQEKPPKQPDRDISWAAIGVMGREGDFDGFIQHDPAGEGSDKVLRYETIEVLASFYGPKAQNYAAILRDGLSIPQNNEPFQAAEMGLADLGSLIVTADLVNQGWIRRVDFTFHVRRTIRREYPVLSLLSLDSDLKTNSGV